MREEVTAVCEEYVGVSSIERCFCDGAKILFVAADLNDLKDFGRKLVLSLQQCSIPSALHGEVSTHLAMFCNRQRVAYANGRCHVHASKISQTRQDFALVSNLAERGSWPQWQLVLQEDYTTTTAIIILSTSHHVSRLSMCRAAVRSNHPTAITTLIKIDSDHSEHAKTEA